MNILPFLAIFLVLLLALYLYLIRPNKKRDIKMAKSYAHRGLHSGDIPENSLAAFSLAGQKGVGVELDVQLTKDKRLVVFHDESLERMCGADKNVTDLTYDELRAYRLAGTSETIPLFSDVLSALKEVPLLCEIKKQGTNSNVEICPYVASEISSYGGDYVIESFSPFVLSWFKKNRPDIVRGQLSANFFESGDLKGMSAFLMTHLLLNFFSRPDFIAYRFTDRSLSLTILKKIFRVPVAGWTARGEDERKTCLQKFDAEIFEI